MTDFRDLYETQAPAYDRMVEAEDADGHLARLLAGWVEAGALAVDVGCGTGRVSRLLLAAGAGRVIGVEPASGMLEVARQRLAGAPISLLRGDALDLPVQDASAQIVVAGWVFGHFTGWFPQDWATRLAEALAEFDRVSLPGAEQIIIETMGTGTPESGPPNDALDRYYAELRAEHGFTETVVATDYVFDDARCAAEATRFFFGDALADRLIADDTARLPEWTGVWHRRR